MQRRTRVGRGRRHTPAQRDKIVASYRRSPLTQKEFAAQAGIGHSTLTFWLRKTGGAKKSAQAAFVPVPNLFSAASPLPAYRVCFPRGVIVEVGPGFQSAELDALLQRVRTL
jgi:transposase-like protein